MSVVIHIYYSGKNGNARKFAEEMEHSGTAERIRNEEGNVQYEYFFPVHDPETVLLIDKWEDQKAIDRHHSSAMMDTIVQLRNKYDLHMKVERYLSDEEGIPSSDRKFVR
ncbi:MAG: antibiotic biosynthesis monooxygenase [Lachnospiraceae bacterium]|nr:antibiotic biosynthesis monooxygenase [Lachnospiraceae bacterium]